MWKKTASSINIKVLNSHRISSLCLCNTYFRIKYTLNANDGNFFNHGDKVISSTMGAGVLLPGSKSYFHYSASWTVRKVVSI